MRRTCGLCGATQPNGYASVYESGQEVWLCHRSEGQDCYLMWTVFGHRQQPRLADVLTEEQQKSIEAMIGSLGWDDPPAD